MKPYKRGNIWWCTYMANGQRHAQSLKTHDRAEALRTIRALEAARDKETFDAAVEVLRVIFGERDADALPIDEAWTEYVRLAGALGRDVVTERTMKDRKRKFDRFRKWLKHNAMTVTDAGDVSGPTAARYAEDLARQGLSPKTRANAIGDLSVIWTLLGKSREGLQNPWKDLAPSTKGSGGTGHAFTQEQEKAVMAAAAKVGKGWPLACLISRHSGLRYGDVATLKWECVDFAAGVLRVTPSKTVRHGVAVSIPIVAPLMAALRAAKDERDKRDEGQEFVLPVHAVAKLHPSGAWYKSLNFREVLDAAGIGEGYTFHSWRHTAASRLGDAGVSAETRKRILGHTTDAMAERYDHAEHLPEMRKALNDAAKVAM